MCTKVAFHFILLVLFLVIAIKHFMIKSLIRCHLHTVCFIKITATSSEYILICVCELNPLDKTLRAVIVVRGAFLFQWSWFPFVESPQKLHDWRAEDNWSMGAYIILQGFFNITPPPFKKILRACLSTVEKNCLLWKKIIKLNYLSLIKVNAKSAWNQRKIIIKRSVEENDSLHVGSMLCQRRRWWPNVKPI